MNENEIPAAPMQLRADPPRVTRLSRKVLAGIGLCASLGVGGALIYALQTSETGRHGRRALLDIQQAARRRTGQPAARLYRSRSWTAAAWRSWPADA